MNAPISRFMAEEHARLGALLDQSVANPGVLDRPPFDAFRAGLLRHIALEEKVLLPAIRVARGGESLPLASRLRLEHGALASLLVGTPTPELAGEIRSILIPHNALEEGEGGLYAVCDDLLAASAGEVLARLASYPAVKVAAYADGPRVCRRAADALRASAGPRQHHSPSR